MMTRRALVLSALLLWQGLASPAATAQETSQTEAWAALASTRQAMKGAAFEARFVQTFVPAGFSQGERESGTISLQLPTCLRWDYETPYARSYLICGQTLHTWNPGEASGRVHSLGSGDESGLDLLRQDIDKLKLRYLARIEHSQGSLATILLVPMTPDAQLARATFTVDTGLGRFTRLSYVDRDGNLSTFEISGYRPLMQGEAFEPPAELEWIGE